MSPIISVATVNDIEEILHLLESSFISYKNLYSTLSYQNTILNRGDLEKRMDEMEVLVAKFSDNRIVGTISWKITSEKSAHIRGMAVDPSYQQMGIGSKLLQEVETRALERNCAKITLETTEFLTKAIRLYQKNGYHHSKNMRDFFGVNVKEYSKILIH